MDSPDQGAYGLPLSDVTFADGVLRFALRRANGALRRAAERRGHRDRRYLDAGRSRCRSC